MAVKDASKLPLLKELIKDVPQQPEILVGDEGAVEVSGHSCAVANASPHSAAQRDAVEHGVPCLRRVCEQVARYSKAESVVTGIVGCAGLLPTVAAIKAKKDICLANKETLIAGGPFVLPLAEEYGVKILPADSEHSAIFQCLQVRSVQQHHCNDPYRQKSHTMPQHNLGQQAALGVQQG